MEQRSGREQAVAVRVVPSALDSERSQGQHWGHLEWTEGVQGWDLPVLTPGIRSWDHRGGHRHSQGRWSGV